jgi:hypothetical protein
MKNKINDIEWKADQLWKGCILASIAHAIMVAHYPVLSNEHSWDGINYNTQDSAGSRGTVTFSSKYCSAAFFNIHSDRNEQGSKIPNALNFFHGAPMEIIRIAKSETLQYLLGEVNGKLTPIITTAFWGIGDQLMSLDQYTDMIKNGGFLLERQVLDFNHSIESWKRYYDMTQQQCELLEIIYRRKISQPNNKHFLSKDEVLMIGAVDSEGLEESKNSFRELNMEWEN